MQPLPSDLREWSDEHARADAAANASHETQMALVEDLLEDSSVQVARAEIPNPESFPIIARPSKSIIEQFELD